MKEEQVTKAIINWLLTNNWEIIAFDFPQSGTGKILHPNKNISEKNKGSIIPDIIAVKKHICIFMENKDRFYLSDFEKLNYIKTSHNYSDAISDLLCNHIIKTMFYGVGLPIKKCKQITTEAKEFVDFVICVNDDNTINVSFNKENIIF